MNREILFRAKTKATKEWTYGHFAKQYDVPQIYAGDGHECVYEDTLCQYTGLDDKNGNKIFEGDILHFGDKNYLVFWNDECFQWQMRTRKDGFSFPIYSGQDTGCPVECITLSWVAAEIPILGTMSTEIVGNIYDNPELIEE
jgi:hypothetical protein